MGLTKTNSAANINNKAKKLNILLIEDEYDHSEIIRRQIEEFNNSIEVIVANSIQKGWEDFNNNTPDLVIVDYKMPDGKGTEFLNKKSKNKNCPVVMMTSYGDQDLAVEAMKLGALDYIVKSAETFAEMPHIIERVLREWEHIKKREKAENKLKKQNKELKKTNLELDKFVYSASHDLRAPLSSILGLINIAKKETENSRMMKYLSMMEDSVKKLDQYTSDITDYSRNARLEIKKSQIDFHDLLGNIIDSLRYFQNFEKIDIYFNVNNNVHLLSDEYRLKIILTNLISNAIKYYNEEQKHPFINIDVYNKGHHVIIQVTDNGLGIDYPFQEKIFDMFFRASEKSEGAGLGLYIAKETVDKLGGQIHLTSKPLNGTTFTLELPQ